ncbi:hypothetical protein [Amycolatopsis rifamycinica]|uniref:RdlA protein n=1 Tax=Amycolatopsis rifamycinica TaxID=287986 RepID=A0A066U4S4_9PSEU|nr:hypothetical protein [Amycolatopsis rifamycinica]KDN19183.1 hypothetical protein DV20_26360 [Amycolatopsis rifamycinica]
MIKQLGFVATALAAGLAGFGGAASAATVDSYPIDQSEQFGLANVQSLDVLHNVNLVGAVCDNTINVLGVQVPLHDVAEGIDVPIMSPGASEAEGSTPSNCASGSIADGGTAQGH